MWGDVDVLEKDSGPPDWLYLVLALLAVMVIINPSVIPGYSTGPSIQNVDIPAGELNTTNSDLTTAESKTTSFLIDVENNAVERCGVFPPKVCINATAMIENTGEYTASGTTVTLRVYADGQQLIKQTEQVGDLRPNETYSTTQEQTLSLSKAKAVLDNGCEYRYEFDVWYNGDQYVPIEDTKELDPERCKIIKI